MKNIPRQELKVEIWGLVYRAINDGKNLSYLEQDKLADKVAAEILKKVERKEGYLKRG